MIFSFILTNWLVNMWVLFHMRIVPSPNMGKLPSIYPALGKVSFKQVETTQTIFIGDLNLWCNIKYMKGLFRIWLDAQKYLGCSSRITKWFQKHTVKPPNMRSKISLRMSLQELLSSPWYYLYKTILNISNFGKNDFIFYFFNSKKQKRQIL